MTKSLREIIDEESSYDLQLVPLLWLWEKTSVLPIFLRVPIRIPLALIGGLLMLCIALSVLVFVGVRVLFDD